jgi:hypothetical protein
LRITLDVQYKRTAEGKIIKYIKQHAMNKINKFTKKNYVAPQVERIELDTEISLQLESTPPEAPGEAQLKTPEYFNNDPFRLA